MVSAFACMGCTLLIAWKRSCPAVSYMLRRHLPSGRDTFLVKKSAPMVDLKPSVKKFWTYLHCVSFLYPAPQKRQHRETHLRRRLVFPPVDGPCVTTLTSIMPSSLSFMGVSGRILIAGRPRTYSHSNGSVHSEALQCKSFNF